MAPFEFRYREVRKKEKDDINNIICPNCILQATKGQAQDLVIECAMILERTHSLSWVGMWVKHYNRHQ